MDATVPNVIAATIAEVEAERAASGKLYRQFMSCGTLSAGLYRLAAGGEDPQQPHAEDEVYYIVSGRARLMAGDEDIAVEPGSTIFVAREVPHRFHDIEEDLSVLVFFAPEHTPQD
ncbi:MAG TPA: cupin domain-containing protein [Thermomicrobiales bacterium]|nr:cupin domain-containing protein [Thermomicrobiales bacterium]